MTEQGQMCPSGWLWTAGPAQLKRGSPTGEAIRLGDSNKLTEQPVLRLHSSLKLPHPGQSLATSTATPQSKVTAGCEQLAISDPAANQGDAGNVQRSASNCVAEEFACDRADTKNEKCLQRSCILNVQTCQPPSSELMLGRLELYAFLGPQVLVQRRQDVVTVSQRAHPMHAMSDHHCARAMPATRAERGDTPLPHAALARGNCRQPGSVGVTVNQWTRLKSHTRSTRMGSFAHA